MIWNMIVLAAETVHFKCAYFGRYMINEILKYPAIYLDQSYILTYIKFREIET